MLEDIFFLIPQGVGLFFKEARCNQPDLVGSSAVKWSCIKFAKNQTKMAGGVKNPPQEREGMQKVDLTTLSLQQLAQLKQQLEQVFQFSVKGDMWT